MDSNFGCKLTTQFDEIIQSIVIVIYEVNLNTCYFLASLVVLPSESTATTLLSKLIFFSMVFPV